MHARGARALVLLVVLAAVAAFFLSGAHRYLSFDALKTEQAYRLASKAGTTSSWPSTRKVTTKPSKAPWF